MAWWNPLDWPGMRAIEDILGFRDWLGGLGGDIASGVEGGFAAIFRDLTAPLIPWFEIILGTIIAIFVLTVYFSQQIASGARLAGLL